VLDENPDPNCPNWVFSSPVNPSIAFDEYPNDTNGTAPYPVGGNANGYDHENPPMFPPADHDAELLKSVAEYEPNADE
jgi:hypothetical protein